ncbi:uncharacterized protein AB675_91 [Cyphellophora attinorum]|uniref:Uncharacterized protein n=1 Tax=Cyphellophora attinorum TaxID=1664694 RepID=A0A0N0NKC5_9EURO|nr:uncharacterized protein AB675_91 [Phialophora attinorum]KPI37679.1 hypothetical protein AB675_91 [Phialophora attinorum]
MPLYYYKDSEGRKGIKRTSASPSPSVTSVTRQIKGLQLPVAEYDPPGHYLYGVPYHRHHQPHRPPAAFHDLPVYSTSIRPYSRCQYRPYSTMSMDGDHEFSDDDDLLGPRSRPSTPKQPKPHPQTMLPAPRLTPRHESVPLDAAARQLYGTVSRAITFFDGFYRSFRTSTDEIRQHANKSLLNSVWQSRIRSSAADPTSGYKHRKTPEDGTDPITNPHNDEHFSFREHQRQVLLRMKQVANAQLLKLPAAAALFEEDDGCYAATNAHSYHDKDLYANQQRHRAAELLQRKVKNGMEDVKYAFEGMSHDYEQAKLASRELKYVKQYLVTMKKCWDKNWRFDEFDGDESDGELADGEEVVVQEGQEQQ